MDNNLYDTKVVKMLQMIYIYKAGYRTGGNTSLNTWLDAKEFCKVNSVEVHSVCEKFSGPMIQGRLI